MTKKTQYKIVPIWVIQDLKNKTQINQMILERLNQKFTADSDDLMNYVMEKTYGSCNPQIVKNTIDNLFKRMDNK